MSGCVVFTIVTLDTQKLHYVTKRSMACSTNNRQKLCSGIIIMMIIYVCVYDLRQKDSSFIYSVAFSFYRRRFTHIIIIIRKSKATQKKGNIVFTVKHVIFCYKQPFYVCFSRTIRDTKHSSIAYHPQIQRKMVSCRLSSSSSFLIHSLPCLCLDFCCFAKNKIYIYIWVTK